MQSVTREQQCVRNQQKTVIRKRMEALHLKQVDVADELGVTPQTVSELLKHDETDIPNREHLAELVDVLGLETVLRVLACEIGVDPDDVKLAEQTSPSTKPPTVECAESSVAHADLVREQTLALVDGRVDEIEARRIQQKRAVFDLEEAQARGAVDQAGASL